MSDVIADLRGQMQERLKVIEGELKDLEALVRERGQIEAALAAPPFAVERPAARRPAARRPVTRAPRGANREAVLTAVGARPGVTAATIAEVTKISRAVTYNTLAKLIEQGRIAKTELPGGQTGYKPGDAAPSEA